MSATNRNFCSRQDTLRQEDKVSQSVGQGLAHAQASKSALTDGTGKRLGQKQRKMANECKCEKTAKRLCASDEKPLTILAIAYSKHNANHKKVSENVSVKWRNQNTKGMLLTPRTANLQKTKRRGAASIQTNQLRNEITTLCPYSTLAFWLVQGVTCASTSSVTQKAAKIARRQR